MDVTAAAAAAGSSSSSSSGSGGCHKVDPNEADEVIERILRPIVQLPEVKLAPSAPFTLEYHSQTADIS